MKIIVKLVLLINVCFIDGNPVGTRNALACQQVCHSIDENKINVHLIPHSHDDVGWVRTFNEYYYGTGSFNDQADAGVQYILNSTIPALKKDSKRRFIQVETAFFWKWWQNQPDNVRQDVINLVNSGQLEIVNGAWSMNDEATTNYQSTIDQFTWGFRILENTVGVCGRPKIGWQIDPFGHSREHASIVKQLGFNGLVVVRIDYRDKQKRQENQNLEFIWKSSQNLDNSEIFTTMFPGHYSDEHGYKFDILHKDEITNSNLIQKVNGFASILDEYRKYYKTSNFMMPMGNDFTYQVAERNFMNMDKLIKGFENHNIYNVFYSTPSCYLKAVQKEIEEKSLNLTTKEDDFFPLAHNSLSYWTGYFTSRPTSKRFERLANNILQSAKQLTTFSRIKGDEYDKNIINLRKAIAVMQHHDAITGTAKQEVAEDYDKMIYKGIKWAEKPMGEIIEKLLRQESGTKYNLTFSTCLLSNISICTNSQQDKFLVAVYNPLAIEINHYVTIPVNGENFKITGPDGEEIYDIFEPIHTFNYLQRSEKVSPREMVFCAKSLPPLGIKLYLVEKVSQMSLFVDLFKQPQKLYEAFKYDVSYKQYQNVLAIGEYYGDTRNGFTVDSTTGKLKSVTIKGISLELSQEFLYYTTIASGAYLFNPYPQNTTSISGETIKTECTKGSLIDQCRQQINNEITQIIKVYKDETHPYIEFDWLVGNLQTESDLGKEVITRFTVKDFNNKNTFYTDSNGREQIRRKLNFRNDFSYDATEEPVSSNYYPVTSKIVIKDENRNLEVAVLNDRSQGGTSLENGVIELMIHRKLVRDDGLGVDEVLNEMQYGIGLYARGSHYLTFGKMNSDAENDVSVAALGRSLALKKLLPPWVLVSDPAKKNLDEVVDSWNLEFSGLINPLPTNVHILTLEPWIDSYLLRLEHILEKEEDENLSKPVTVDLNDLFTLFSITEMKETTLGANEILDPNVSDFRITLNPMQIRTFIIKTDQNNIGGHEDEGFEDEEGSGGGDKSNSNIVSSKNIYAVTLLIFIQMYF